MIGLGLGRQTGKTIAAVETVRRLRAEGKDAVLICFCDGEARRVQEAHRLPDGAVMGPRRESLLGRRALLVVDNLDLVLEALLGSPVHSATYTDEPRTVEPINGIAYWVARETGRQLGKDAVESMVKVPPFPMPGYNMDDFIRPAEEVEPDHVVGGG